MDEGEVQSILRCGHCNKPFDKQSTLKRHGYYCRSRKAGSSIRPRSCISCARGKARCDNRRPECSRCTTKAIECHYPTSTPRSTGPRVQHNDDISTENTPPLVADTPSVEDRRDASNDGGMILDSALAISDLEVPNLGDEYLGWDDPNFDFTDFLNPQTNDDTVEYLSPSSSSLVYPSTPSFDQTAQAQQAISPFKVSLPPLPTTAVRSLHQRIKLKTGAQRIANLILHTLKSYPQTILRHNTLPPFIHPHSVCSGAEDNNAEPLNNCVSLLHMINSGVQGSRKLFWKNVRLECEQWRAEHIKYNNWQLLSAMQALCIYILFRLSEGETDHNNLDYLLLTTVTVIGKEFAGRDLTYNAQTALDNYDLKKSWKDWLFEESRRRLCVIYQAMNMLVYFDPAEMCDLHQTDLLLAPLPARKHLWEADNEYAWKAESEKEPGVQTTFGLTAKGELVKLDEGQLYCKEELLPYKSSDAITPSRSTGHWEEWCSGMDGFGGLVMLVASLTA